MTSGSWQIVLPLPPAGSAIHPSGHHHLAWLLSHATYNRKNLLSGHRQWDPAPAFHSALIKAHVFSISVIFRPIERSPAHPLVRPPPALVHAMSCPRKGERAAGRYCTLVNICRRRPFPDNDTRGTTTLPEALAYCRPGGAATTLVSGCIGLHRHREQKCPDPTLHRPSSQRPMPPCPAPESQIVPQLGSLRDPSAEIHNSRRPFTLSPSSATQQAASLSGSSLPSSLSSLPTINRLIATLPVAPENSDGRVDVRHGMFLSGRPGQRHKRAQVGGQVGWTAARCMRGRKRILCYLPSPSRDIQRPPSGPKPASCR